MIDRKEEWNKNGEALFETVDVGVGEKDVGLEGGGECQRLQKMNFDYSVLSASKKLDKKNRVVTCRSNCKSLILAHYYNILAHVYWAHVCSEQTQTNSLKKHNFRESDVVKLQHLDCHVKVGKSCQPIKVIAAGS